MEDDNDDAPPLFSSSSLRARDDVFCHETARRAVARAALHLGIESMSVEAADSMAGIVLAYLGRIGQAMASTVEASGRSSAHANLLDALRAIEICTEPAVTGLFADSASAPQAAREVNQPESERYNHDEQMSWKGLAAFCFGKQWREPLETSAVPGGNASANPMNRGRGGKGVGGSGEDTDMSNLDGEEENAENDGAAGATASTGWRAPYPEEIIPFPVANPAVANPHNLPEDILEAEEVPDEAFAENGDRKRPREEDEKERSSKKAKVGEEGAAMSTANMPDTKNPAAEKKEEMDVSPTAEAPGTGASLDDDKHRPWDFPKHWPSFPRKEMGTQALVLDDNPLGVDDGEVEDILGEMEGRAPTGARAEAEGDPTRSVRSALVQMGWGSMRERTGLADPYDLRVSAGAKFDSAGAKAQAQIVPLGKASISRVNRILEGSMDGGM